jgi:hypothetical protein
MCFLGQRTEAIMHPGYVLLGFIGLALVFAFMHFLDKLAGGRKSAARRRQSGIEPMGETTITHLGHS